MPADWQAELVSMCARIRALRARIAPNHIGQYGQLQEWLEDRDDPKDEHRHVSHLWGLHPGAEITRRGTVRSCLAFSIEPYARAVVDTGHQMGVQMRPAAAIG